VRPGAGEGLKKKKGLTALTQTAGRLAGCPACVWLAWSVYGLCLASRCVWLFGPCAAGQVRGVWLMAWSAWPGSCVALWGGAVWQVARVWLVGRVWVVCRLCLEGHVGLAGSVCGRQGRRVAGQAGVWVVARVWPVGHAWLAWPVCVCGGPCLAGGHPWLVGHASLVTCGRRARCGRSTILYKWGHCG